MSLLPGTKPGLSHPLLLCMPHGPDLLEGCMPVVQGSRYLEHLTAKEVLFGVPQATHKGKIINTMLLYVRYYIQRQKLFHNGILELLPWLQEFKQKLAVEEWISTKMLGKNTFRIWTPIRNWVKIHPISYPSAFATSNFAPPAEIILILIIIPIFDSARSYKFSY